MAAIRNINGSEWELNYAIMYSAPLEHRAWPVEMAAEGTKVVPLIQAKLHTDPLQLPVPLANRKRKPKNNTQPIQT